MDTPFHAGILAVGSAGCTALANVAAALPRTVATAAIDTDAASLATCPAERKLLLRTPQAAPQAQARRPVVPLPPCIITPAIEEERTTQRRHRLAELRTAAAPYLAELQAWADGLDVLFLLGGLGGMAGTALLPLLAERLSCPQGVIAVVFTPFDFEAPWRHQFAHEALAQLQQTEAVRSLLELQGETEDDLAQNRCHAAEFCRLLVEAPSHSGIVIPLDDWLHIVGKGGATLIQARSDHAEQAIAASLAELRTVDLAGATPVRALAILEGPAEQLMLAHSRQLMAGLARQCTGREDLLAHSARSWPATAPRQAFSVTVIWRELSKENWSASQST